MEQDIIKPIEFVFENKGRPQHFLFMDLFEKATRKLPEKKLGVLLRIDISPHIVSWQNDIIVRFGVKEQKCSDVCYSSFQFPVGIYDLLAPQLLYIPNAGFELKAHRSFKKIQVVVFFSDLDAKPKLNTFVLPNSPALNL